MNQDYKDIFQKIQSLVKDNELAALITEYIVTLDENKRFKAGQKDPRIKVPNTDRTDGWRERVQRNFGSANDGEIGR